MRFWIICLAVLFSSLVSHAQMPAFTGFGEGFSVQKGSDIVLDNLPRTMSQDSIGQCASWAATAMLQINNCRIKKQNCKDLPESELFSPLDVARFGKKADGDISYESSYRGISLDGSTAALAMEVVGLHVGSAATEACMSLDKVLEKLGGVTDYAEQSQSDAFDKLKELYAKSQKIDKKCETCLSKFVDSVDQDICERFNVKNDPKVLLKAFSEDTFEKFLDQLVSPPECKRAKNRAFFEGKDSMELQSFPKTEKDKNYKSIVAKIKSVLDQKLPVLIQGICVTEKKTKKCDSSNSHATVITGYSRMCDTAGNCYDALKIQNSWGETWQKSKNGGWVAADELLQNTPFQTETLTWLQDKPK
ncbi:hypothetical protein ACLVWU_05430 [Bdellovibrio sp. HCB290]|uniref:hypothetical protein n=1 Tax=Bdellovibrio sp. HCB290 TaxID=3394356 RepID=UPI0039B39FEB